MKIDERPVVVVVWGDNNGIFFVNAMKGTEWLRTSDWAMKKIGVYMSITKRIFSNLMVVLLLLTFTAGCDLIGEDEDSGSENTSEETEDNNEVAECLSGETLITEDGDEYTLFLDGTQLVSAEANLSAGGFQNFEALLCGQRFGDSLLNVFQTGVTDLTNGWDEEHVIPASSTVEADADNPPYEILSLAIDHVDTIGELTGDDKTLFNSDDLSGLTYALRIYNEDGSLADCLAWGHDVFGMFAGQVPTNNFLPPTDISEISAANCFQIN